MQVKSQSEVAQSCLTLSDPIDCSPPGSSINGIFQARVLEWGAIAFSAWSPSEMETLPFLEFPHNLTCRLSWRLWLSVLIFWATPPSLYWCWSWNSNSLAIWSEELTHSWCWERLKAGKEGDDGGWDSWMALPTQWTWVWVDSGSWWWTGRPGVLRFMRLQRVGHDWATELHWTDPGMGRQILNNWIVAFASTCPGITFSDFLEIWLWRLGLHSHFIVFMVLSLRTPGPQQTLTQNYDLKMFYVWKNLEIKI